MKLNPEENTSKYKLTSKARAQADGFLAGNGGVHSAMLVDMDYYDRISAGFSKIFADTVVDTIMADITAAFGDIDYFACYVYAGGCFILLKNTSQETALEHAKKAVEIFSSKYIGESGGKKLTAACKIGVSSGAFDNFDEYYEKAAKALSYIQKTPERVCQYTDDMRFLKYPKATDYLQDDRKSQDCGFLSIAAKLLTRAHEESSTINLLLKMAGMRYGLTSVFICRYNPNLKTMYKTHMWTRKKGVLHIHNQSEEYPGWSFFMKGFDRNGYMTIEDYDNKHFNDEDRQFFKNIKMRSSINCILYNDNKMIGYISFCDSINARKWSSYEAASMYEIAMLLAMYMSKNINAKADNEIREAPTDNITGLMTASPFTRKAQKLFADAEKNTICAVTCSDINNFSYVNENFGFFKGNQVLSRLADTFRESTELCCRISADKFLTFDIFPDAETALSTIAKWNMNFNRELKSHYPVSDLRLSTGICLMDSKYDDIHVGIERSNTMRKLIKNNRKHSYAVFTEEQNEQNKKELEIIGSIHKAIANGEIEAFLQPKYSLSQNRIIGAEALARWRKPDGTLISPADFIPVLERVGYIVDVDFCIYEQILKCFARWKSEGKELIPISVNFSRKHTGNPDFVNKIRDLAEKYNVDKSYIEIEITESSVSDNNQIMLGHLHELQHIGFKVDMDDFGTGYSSLDLLIDAPIDIVKIDKCFIDKVGSEKGRLYIKQIADLVTASSKDIIFEGVETQTQADFLLQSGYSKIQGYFFGGPVPIIDFEKRYMN